MLYLNSFKQKKSLLYLYVSDFWQKSLTVNITTFLTMFFSIFLKQYFYECSLSCLLLFLFCSEMCVVLLKLKDSNMGSVYMYLTFSLAYSNEISFQCKHHLIKDEFPLAIGVCQGCLFTAILFNVFLEFVVDEVHSLHNTKFECKSIN